MHVEEPSSVIPIMHVATSHQVIHYLLCKPLSMFPLDHFAMHCKYSRMRADTLFVALFDTFRFFCIVHTCKSLCFVVDNRQCCFFFPSPPFSSCIAHYIENIQQQFVYFNVKMMPYSLVSSIFLARSLKSISSICHEVREQIYFFCYIFTIFF